MPPAYLAPSPPNCDRALVCLASSTDLAVVDAGNGYAFPVKDWLLNRAFGTPRGVLGALGGWIMARTKGELNRVVVEHLDLRPEDRVLEIGFGPGTLLRLIAGRTPHVAGVDPSGVMLRQARRRNPRADLHQAGVSRMPFEDGRFTRAVAVHSFQLWPEPERDLQEVRRVMAPGGLLLLAFQAAGSGQRGPKWDESQLEGYRARLQASGFKKTRARIIDGVGMVTGLR